MPILVDTSILARLANVADPAYAMAENAMDVLHGQGELLHITAQNMIEFRNVATRPKSLNGLGLSIAEADAKTAVFEATFTLLVETSDIYPKWKSIVNSLGVIGK